MKLPAGVVHDLPEDLEKVLNADEQKVEWWNSLTPIQRNEWICWVTMAKKAETRVKRINRLLEDSTDGKRQPCCWPGCPHRRESAKKWFTNLDSDQTAK